MRIGTEDKKKLKLFGVVGTLGVAAAVYIFSQLYVSDAPKTAPAPVVTTAPARVQTVSKTAAKSDTAMPSLDPTLKMGPMLVTEALVYSGNGRNIFSMTSAPVEMPKPVAPPRPKTPLPPPPPVYTGPPPPPPIDLKFFGTATAKNGDRQAFLLHGDDVFLASPGDIVQRRYRIVSLSANSIIMVDLTNNNQQTLPLIIR
jgi:hypothetical protein